jgi:hypothetical protein
MELPIFYITSLEEKAGRRRMDTASEPAARRSRRRPNGRGNTVVTAIDLGPEGTDESY